MRLLFESEAQLNPYSPKRTGTNMVLIQCPHCEKDIEVGDGVFGLFDCPYCNEEFEYESSTNSGAVNVRHETSINMTLKVGLFLLFVSFLTVIFAVMYLVGGMNDFNDSEIKCDGSDGGGGSSGPWDLFSLEYWLGNCGPTGDFGLGSFCCSIMLILFGIGVGFSALVSLLTGAVRGNKKVMIIQPDDK